MLKGFFKKDHTYRNPWMIEFWKKGVKLSLILSILFFSFIGLKANSLFPLKLNPTFSRLELKGLVSGLKLGLDSVIIDTANTGGVVCSGNSQGTLTINAHSTTNSTLSFSIDSGITFQSSNLFPGIPPGVYKVLVKDALGNTASYLANLISDAQVIASTSSLYNCIGSNFQLNINANGSTYSWTGPNGFTSTLKNPVLNNVQLADSGLYSVDIQTGTCIETFSVLVQVNSPPQVFTVNGGGTYCGTGFVYLKGSKPNVLYQLVLNGINEGSYVVANAYDGVYFQVQKSGDYSIFAYDLTTSCTGFMSGDALITINPVPIQKTVSGAGEYCIQDTLKVLNSESGVNYQMASLKPVNHGLTGQYYSNPTFTGNPLVSRVDSAINFPDLTLPGLLPGGIPTTYFSVKWSGYLKAPVTGAYTFYTNSDDGIRMSVDGNSIINDFQPHPSRYDTSSSLNLVAGQYYFVTIDYYNAAVSSQAQIFWTYPGQVGQLIPASQWYLPNSFTLLGSTQAGNGSALSFPITQSGDYIILGTGPTGCSTPIGGADSVIIDQSPTTANAGGNQTLCLGVNFVLSGNTPVIGTGFWTQVSGPSSAMFVNPYAAQTAVNGLIAGAYVFQWTISNGVCTSSSQVTITITPPPDTPNAGPNQNLCGVTTATLAGNNPSSGMGTWTQISGTNATTITNPNAYNSTVTGLISGNYVYQWSITSGSCTSSSSAVTITINPAPDPSNAGPNQNLCNATNTSLNGNNPVVGNGAWTFVSGPNIPTIQNPSSYNTSIYGLIPGNYVFQWSITNSFCAANSSTVSIVNSAPPTVANAGNNQTACTSVSQIQLNGNSPIIGNGTWSLVSGPNAPVFSNPNSPQSNLSGFILGTYVIQWTISNGACSSFSTDTLYIVPPPTTALVGPDQNLCNLSSTTLSGNTPTNGIGTWVETSGPACIITNPHSPITTVTGLSPGIFYFQWQIKIPAAGCSSSAGMVVQVFSPPTLSISGPKQNLCNQTSANLSGNKPLIGSGTWTQVSGPNSANIQLPDSSITGVSGLIPGTYIFNWTISNGACSASTSSDTLMIFGNPSLADAGSNQNFCNVNSVNLLGNTPGVGTGLWSQISGPNVAIILSPGSPNTKINGLIPGTYIFSWTISNGSCVSSSSQVTIKIYPLPDNSNAGSNQSLCNISTAQLNGNQPVNGIGQWSQVSGPNLANLSNPSLYNTQVSGLIPGLYVFSWTISSGSCPSSSSQVNLNILGSPSQSNAGPKQTFCSNGTANLNGNTPLVGTGNWTQISGPNLGNISLPSSPNTLVTGLIPGTYIFSWTISNGICTSNSSNDTLLIQAPISTAIAGPKQVLCNVNTAILSANIPSSGTGIWAQVSGPNSALIQNSNSASTSVNGLIPGTYIFNWTISNGICPVSSALDTLVINPLVILSNPGVKTVLCNTISTSFTGPNPGTGTGTWTQITGPNSASIQSANSPGTQFTGLIPGTYIFRWTITNGTCYTSTTEDTLINNPLPSISNAGINQAICNTSVASLSGNIPLVGIGIWSQLSGPNTALIVNPGSGNTQIKGLTPGKYIFQWSISLNPCSSNSSSVTIFVSDSLKIKLVQVTDILCSGVGKGSATVQASGGTPSYHFAWNTIPVQTSATAVNLDSGTYQVTLTDSVGCNTQLSVRINEAPPLVLSIHNPPPVFPPFTVDLTQPSIVTGSTSGMVFSYFLDSLATQILGSPNSVSTSGTYYIKGVNSNSCSTLKPVQVIIKPVVLPVPNPDSGITQVGKSITLAKITKNDIQGTYPINASSIDLDPFQPGIQSQFTLPGEGFFTVNSAGDMVFFPFGNFSGKVSIPYTVADQYGNRSNQTANIIILINPIASNDTIIMPWNTSINLKELVKGKGRLNPGLTTVTQSPLHGTFSINPLNGDINYTPNKNYFGQDSLYYTVCDSTLPKPLCSSPALIEFTIYSIADVSIQKIAPARVDNDVYTYTLIVSNAGPGDASQIVVTDTLPGNMVFVSSNKDKPDFNTSNNVLTWNIPSILNGQKDTLVITVNTPDIGPITNTAHVKAHEVDPNFANNVSSVSINKIGEILFFPTLFTPNGDGVNDYFVIHGLEDYPENEIHIFNRWGNEVYHANTYMRGGRIWDGSNLDAGTYFYVLNVVVNGASLRYSGYTTIIRFKK